MAFARRFDEPADRPALRARRVDQHRRASDRAGRRCRRRCSLPGGSLDVVQFVLLVAPAARGLAQSRPVPGFAERVGLEQGRREPRRRLRVRFRPQWCPARCRPRSRAARRLRGTARASPVRRRREAAWASAARALPAASRSNTAARPAARSRTPRRRRAAPRPPTGTFAPIAAAAPASTCQPEPSLTSRPPVYSVLSRRLGQLAIGDDRFRAGERDRGEARALRPAAGSAASCVQVLP